MPAEKPSRPRTADADESVELDTTAATADEDDALRSIIATEGDADAGDDDEDAADADDEVADDEDDDESDDDDSDDEDADDDSDAAVAATPRKGGAKQSEAERRAAAREKAKEKARAERAAKKGAANPRKGQSTSTDAKTPAGTKKHQSSAASAAAAAASKQRRRPARPEGANPVWFKPLMFGFLIVGFLWIIVFYLSSGRFPIAELGSWNILVGFGIAFVGFLMTTNWK